MIRLEHYVSHSDRRLRLGYTTGTCAAAATSAATTLLLTGTPPVAVTIQTPSGIDVCVEVEANTSDAHTATCATRKDAGDDPDVTDGILIYARVAKSQAEGVSITGGVGVGRVSLPGLDQPPGEAAINSVPRAMIERAATQAARKAGYRGGLAVEIFVPAGEEVAKRTMNERLGIKGGISILGTTGIVRPMSEDALIKTIQVELKVAYAGGARDILLVPGNYAERYVSSVLGLKEVPCVRISNYVGAALDEAQRLGFDSVLLVGHAGKLIKLAAGIFNTHSSVADGRFEVLATHAALCGAPAKTIAELRGLPTVDAMLDALEQACPIEPIMRSVARSIEDHLSLRTTLDAGCIVFSNARGELLRTARSTELLARLIERRPA